jgi:sorbitol/mannitol transport system permease protein
MSRRDLTLAERQTNPWLRAGIGVGTWVIVLVFFFPVFWMALTGLKHEQDAATSTPKFFFKPTLDEFRSVWNGQGQSSLASFLERSVVITLTSTVIVLVLALPAAYALSLRPVRKWRDVLFFMISTKMLPIVGAIIPLYVLARDLHLLNSRLVLILLYTSMNMPIAVWMMRSFLLEVPVEVIEASRVDGAGLIRQLRSVVVPMISPGLAATALICFIFAWNEFFLAVNLTSTNSTVPVYLVSFVAPEGQFWAHLSAAATVACLPVLIAGWAAQDKLVRGLSMGALK